MKHAVIGNFSTTKSKLVSVSFFPCIKTDVKKKKKVCSNSATNEQTYNSLYGLLLYIILFIFVFLWCSQNLLVLF